MKKKKEVMNIRGQPGERASPSIGHSREDLFSLVRTASILAGNNEQIT